MGSGSAGIPAAPDGVGLTSPASSRERWARSLKKTPARAVGPGPVARRPSKGGKADRRRRRRFACALGNRCELVHRGATRWGVRRHTGGPRCGTAYGTSPPRPRLFPWRYVADKPGSGNTMDPTRHSGIVDALEAVKAAGLIMRYNLTWERPGEPRWRYGARAIRRTMSCSKSIAGGLAGLVTEAQLSIVPSAEHRP